MKLKFILKYGQNYNIKSIRNPVDKSMKLTLKHETEIYEINYNHNEYFERKNLNEYFERKNYKPENFESKTSNKDYKQANVECINSTSKNLYTFCNNKYRIECNPENTMCKSFKKISMLSQQFLNSKIFAKDRLKGYTAGYISPNIKMFSFAFCYE